MSGLDGKRARKGAPMEERILLHVLKTPGGCWRWTAAQNGKGYGRVWIGGRAGRLMYAHRVSYETFVGPIPPGLQVDHLCRNRCCVNPAHLEVVTPQVNTLRGESTGAQALRRSHCLYGHDYETHGIINCGRRICRMCRDTYQRLYKEVPYVEVMRRKKAGEPVVDLAAHFGARRVA